MNTFKITIVVFAPAVLIAMAPIANQNSEQHHNHLNVVEVTSDTENLSTLVAAVQAAGLYETLSGDGPFTVFAPTNEAFEALPDGTLESLLEPANRDMLVDILTYHVIRRGNVRRSQRRYDD